MPKFAKFVAMPLVNLRSYAYVMKQVDKEGYFRWSREWRWDSSVLQLCTGLGSRLCTVVWVLFGASLNEPHINRNELREWDIIYILCIWYIGPSLVIPCPMSVIPYIWCSNTATCKFILMSLEYRLIAVRVNVEQSNNWGSREGESETELVVNRSLSSTAANNKRKN